MRLKRYLYFGILMGMLMGTPLQSYAAEETAEASSEDVIETDADGNPIETLPPPPTFPSGYAMADKDFKGTEADYYVIVRAKEAADKALEMGEPLSLDESNGVVGIRLRQLPDVNSKLSLNLVIPDGTLLYITGEVNDENGNLWGYTNYADMKTGYVELSKVAKASVITAQELVRRENTIGGRNPEFTKFFQRIDSEGKPISLEDMTSESGENEGETVETDVFPPLETDENGDPILETDADGNQIIETNAYGEPVFRVDSEGNLMIPKDYKGNPVFETDSEGNPVIPLDEDGNPRLPELPKKENEKKKGGSPVIPFLLGMLTVILIEVLVTAVMILLRKRKKKKAMNNGTDVNQVDAIKRKKKTFRLKLPKIGFGKKKAPKS